MRTIDPYGKHTASSACTTLHNDSPIKISFRFLYADHDWSIFLQMNVHKIEGSWFEIFIASNWVEPLSRTSKEKPYLFKIILCISMSHHGHSKVFDGVHCRFTK